MILNYNNLKKTEKSPNGAYYDEELERVVFEEVYLLIKINFYIFFKKLFFFYLLLKWF